VSTKNKWTLKTHYPYLLKWGISYAYEQDAILLAESVKAERLIIDDLEGRREAVHRGLPVIGTLGLLAEAARRICWTYRRHSSIYKQPTFTFPPGLSRFCLQTMLKDGEPVSPARAAPG
jgi:hypothetical protein